MEAFAYSEASLNTAPYEAVHLEKKNAERDGNPHLGISWDV
jgi:hypothetical protein